MSTPIEKLEFMTSFPPLLASGKYRVHVDQELKGDQKAIEFNEANTQVPPDVVFHIESERFRLQPQEIGTMYPPKLAVGDYARVLPQLSLTRATLPWERQGIIGDAESPWLALLLFREEEYQEVQEKVITLESLNEATVDFPDLDLDGRPASEEVRVMDVPRSLLEKVLPKPADLSRSAHARRVTYENQEKPTTRSYLICPRLPGNGQLNTVCLVSLEGRYTSQGFHYTDADKPVRLVKLLSWQFTSGQNYQVLPSHIKEAGGMLDALGVMVGKSYASEEDFEKDFRKAMGDGWVDSMNEATKRQVFNFFSQGNLTNKLRALDSSQLQPEVPGNVNEGTANFLSSGYQALPHFVKRGGKMVSWYRGPLMAGKSTRSIDFPAHSSDALLTYHQGYGMLDVSYANAWELGRLLGIKQSKFSKELHQWKRKRARYDHQARQKDALETDHLKQMASDKGQANLPESVSTFLQSLVRLEGIPFHYLIPDETWLPVESIRFFRVDPLWIKALLDGALSIGRVSSSHHGQDQKLQEEEALLSEVEMSGFIMRSEVVDGWPELQIEGFQDDSENRPVKLIRQHKMSDQILLCLFEGTIKRLDIYQMASHQHATIEPGIASSGSKMDAEGRVDLSGLQDAVVQQSVGSSYLQYGKTEGISFKGANPLSLARIGVAR